MKLENVTKFNFTALGLSSFVVLFVIIWTGCTNTNPYSKSSAPLCLGVAYDVSQSVANVEMPAMNTAQLEQILAMLKKRGGVIAFGVVDEKSFEPLLRAQVVPVQGQLDERAQRNQKNIKVLANFTTAVSAKFNRPRNARRTDINGSIARFTLFFNEPNHPANAEKVFICVSDGFDTGAWRKFKGIHLADDVRVFAVGMETRLAEKLFGANVTLFESIDAAIKSLDHSSQ